MVFVAQWSAVLIAYDTTETATIVISLENGTGTFEVYSDVTGNITEVKFTYTLSGTAIAITLANNDVFNGTLDGTDITVTITYSGKNYVFKPSDPVPTGAPTVTFNANGGTGNAPTVTPTFDSNSGKYKIVLPANTYTAPQGQEFKCWEITEGGKNYGEYKAGRTYIADAGSNVVIKAVWSGNASLVQPEGSVTFVGACKVPEQDLGLITLGGQTYTKIVVGYSNETPVVTYYLSDGTSAFATGAHLATIEESLKSVYGADATYIELRMADNLVWYLLIKADNTKLTICDNQTPNKALDNGEFTAENGGTIDPPADKTIDDYIGVWGGELVVGSTTYVGVIIDEEVFALVTSDGDIGEYYYENAQINIVDGKLVLTYSSMTAKWTLKFVSDSVLNVENVKNSILGSTTKQADFAPTHFVTVTFSLGAGVEGTAPEAQQVVPGVFVGEPRTNPTRFGYRFKGWFAPGATTPYDFEETPITADITLTAQWEQIVNVTVTFQVKNGNSGYNGNNIVQTIPFNTKVEKPADLVCDGYYFLGWFTTYAAKTEFDFTTNITDNISIWAGWEKAITLTTVIPGQESTTQPVRKNDEITFAAAPEYIDGYTFVGWSVNNSSVLKQPGDKHTIASVDVTVTAVFTTQLSNGSNASEHVFTLRTDNKVIYALGEPENYENVYAISAQGIVTLSRSEAYYIDREAKLYWLLDGMQGVTLATTDGNAQLVLNGRGGATIGGKELAYTYTSGTLTVTDDNGEHEVTLGTDKDGNRIVTAAVTLTVEGTAYAFGPSSEGPDPTPAGSVKTYTGSANVEGTICTQIVIDEDNNTVELTTSKGAVYPIELIFDEEYNAYNIGRTLGTPAYAVLSADGKTLTLMYNWNGEPDETDIYGTLTLVEG